MKQFFAFFFLILCTLKGQAQFKNIQLDPNGGYDPSVAVSKDDSQRIVASAAPDNIYYSVNGGFSWDKTKLTSLYGVSGNMILTSDFKGNFYCVHHSWIKGKSQIVIQESKNGGKTWSEGTLVSVDTSRYAVKPSLVINRKGDFYCTWTEFEQYTSDSANCVSRVLLARSSNGKKWSKPLEISQTTGTCKDDDSSLGASMAAVMGEGQRAFVAWAGREQLFYDRAFDAGNTWLSTDLPIAYQIGGWEMEIPGLTRAEGIPMLICDDKKRSQVNGALYVLWADQLRGSTDTDIWFTRSLNFGDSWTQPSRINDDKPGKHQYLPHMALDSETGYLYIIYYDRRNYEDQSTDLYLAYSKDSGATFRNVKISESPFVSDASVTAGSYMSISANDGTILPIWTRTDKGKSSIWASIIRQEDLENIKKP